MFKTCVDQLVRVTLTNETINTEWAGGALFVRPLNLNQAHRVYRRLEQTLGVGKVKCNPIGTTGEWAYDFL